MLKKLIESICKILTVFPIEIYFQGNVTRQCEKDGHWYISNHTNLTWTDYSGCGQIFIKKSESYPLYESMVPIIKTVTHFGYGISLAALILSVVIFATIK